jgi:tetratricopeptide (TPR) repeat protein
MSHPNWIKTELSRHFAALDLDRGVDFNRNGEIDESERTDTNGDGRVDVDEWRSFLEKNEAPLTNLGGFFKSYFTAGQAFAPDNPIHDLLEIESKMVSPHLVISAYRFVEGILKTTVKRLSEKEFSSLQKLVLPYNIMQEIGIEFKDNGNATFTQGIDYDILDCDTSSSPVHFIAHELGWPTHLVAAPGHFFIRWDDGKDERFNVDYGFSHPDSYYRTRDSISETAIAGGVYLKNCDRDGVLSLFLGNRGFAKEKLGDFKGAIADYDEAIHLNPKYVSAFNHRAIAKYRLGDFEDAIADYDEAIHLNPKYVSAFNNRALAKYKLGDYKGAIADFDAALRLDPKNTKAFNNRGNTKYKLGDYKGAIADYDAALRLDPKNTKAFNNRALAKDKLERRHR